MAYNVISCQKVAQNTQILKIAKFAIWSWLPKSPKIAQKMITLSITVCYPQKVRPCHIIISPVFCQDVRTRRAQYTLRGYDFLNFEKKYLKNVTQGKTIVFARIRIRNWSSKNFCDHSAIIAVWWEREPCKNWPIWPLVRRIDELTLK